MQTRMFAPVLGEGHKAVLQYLGWPPELTDGQDERIPLPTPKGLIIEEHTDGIFLNRFAELGSFGGDTWHLTMDEAKEQAKYELGDAVGEWRDTPVEIEDSVAYALEQVA